MLAEQSLAAGVAERGERLFAAGLRVREQFPERGVAAQRVELRGLFQYRRDEVGLGYCALQVGQASLVLADVAQQPALLEDRLGILGDLEADLRRRRLHVVA